MNAVVHILSDSRGTYIPRDFITDSYNEIAEDHCKAWGLNEGNKEDWQDCLDPDSEFYWESWDWILNNAKFVTESGDVYTLYQDGDLWGICYDKMSDEEKKNFGFDC